jgi:putative transposase
VNAVIECVPVRARPDPEQDAVLRSHCGGQRFAFNWGLALMKANLEQRGLEKSYGVPATELTC